MERDDETHHPFFERPKRRRPDRNRDFRTSRLQASLPAQPLDGRDLTPAKVLPFPTVDKYTHPEDMALAYVAHNLGFTPAPFSRQRVKDKSQAVPFLFKDQPVRAVAGRDGEPWFVARDV